MAFPFRRQSARPAAPTLSCLFALLLAPVAIGVTGCGEREDGMIEPTMTPAEQEAEMARENELAAESPPD